MNAAYFINTPFQRGRRTRGDDENRLNSLLRGVKTVKTVETVFIGSRKPDPWLKPGVDEVLRENGLTT